MAEFVQYRAEQTVSELEQMQRIELFNKEEIRLIAIKRKRYEYKMQRRTKPKDTYLRYIQYELDLIRLIKLRRDKTKIFYKESEIEHAIRGRVNNLFTQALARYSGDIKLWMSQIRFCQACGFNSSISGILVRLLSRHSDKPKLWKFAAKWELEQNSSIENARKYILRGIRFHPKSTLLYKTFFHMELKYADQQRKMEVEKDLLEKELVAAENEIMEEKLKTAEKQTEEKIKANMLKNEGVLKKEPKIFLLDTKLAEVVLQSALRVFNDVQLPIDLCLIAKKVEYSEPLQQKIVEMLQENFPNEELVYDLEAKLELGSETSAKPCTRAYSKALASMPTERMWTLYLETLLSKNNGSMKTRLLNEFERCHSKGLLNEMYYPKMIKLKLKRKHPDAIPTLLAALDRFPKIAELHKLRVDHYVKNGEEDLALSAFELAEESLGKDSSEMLPLYMAVIKHLQSSNLALADKFFKRSLMAGPNVSTDLKPCYLQWVHDLKDIDAARNQYKTMSLIPPLCLKLHTKMVELEMAQPEINAKNIRSCYDLATHQFGDKDPDLWMEFIAFETEDGDPKMVSLVYDRAKARLSADLLDEFVTKFTLRRSGAMA